MEVPSRPAIRRGKRAPRKEAKTDKRRPAKRTESPAEGLVGLGAPMAPSIVVSEPLKPAPLAPEAPAQIVRERPYEFDDRLRDYKNVLYLIWKHLGLPEPTAIQYDIMDLLQYGPRRQIIEALRGVGKSYVAGAYHVANHFEHPWENALVLSASKQKADQFTSFCLQIINTMPLFAPLRPRRDQRQSMVAYDVGPAPPSQTPSMVSKGITSQITGDRGDKVTPDDIETPLNSATPARREQILSLIREVDAIVKPEGGRVAFLGTPQSEDSIYVELESRGYVVSKIPARYPTARQVITYGKSLHPRLRKAVEENPALQTGGGEDGEQGQPTEPTRFHEIDLQEREKSWGRSGFALQFMLDTSLSDALKYPLRMSDFIVLEADATVAPPKVMWGKETEAQVPYVGLRGDRFYRPLAIVGRESPLPYSTTQLAVDPSGRGECEMGWNILSELNGYLWLRAAGGLRGGYSPENLLFLANIAKKFNINCSIWEDNFGDGAVTELWRPVVRDIHPHTIENVHTSQAVKDLRIIGTLEPAMNQHRIIVDPSVIIEDYESVKTADDVKGIQYSLFYQLSRIQKERGSLAKYDRCDALALGVAKLISRLSQSADVKMEEAKQAARDKALEDFITGVTGRRSQETWHQLGDDWSDGRID